MHKAKFHTIFFSTATLALSLVAVVNFMLDGGGIYASHYIFKQEKPFEDKKVFAVTNITMDERILKKFMAQDLAVQHRKDCAFIGSSRAMLISSVYKTAPPACQDIVNLAVSGAGIEDIIIYSYFLAQLPQEKLPKDIYFELSHWALQWGVEASWVTLKSDYEEGLKFFSGERKSAPLFDAEFIQNLISFDYMSYSIQSFIENDYNLNPKPFIEIREYFDPEKGPEESSIIKDGSRVYSREQRENHKHPEITIAESYNSDRKDIDQSTLPVLKKIVDYFRGKHVNVHFVLMPYHSVTTGQKSPLYQNINNTETALKNFSSEEHIPLQGRFFITNTPCTDQDMLDFMHASEECVRQILKD